MVWGSTRNDGRSPPEGVGIEDAALVHRRRSQWIIGPVAARVTSHSPGMLPAAGGRGRSCGPGCAARVLSDLAVRRCALPVAALANWVCVLMCPFYRPFSSRSSWRSAAGGQAALPAVAYGFPVFSDQSAGMEDRALSLGRDFIDAMVVEAP